MKHALRYLRTLRHLKAGQIAWRARRVLREKLLPPPRYENFKPPRRYDEEVRANLRAFLRSCNAHEPISTECLERLRERHGFASVHEAAEAPDRTPWRLDGASKLTHYTLHYMEWVRTLAQANVDECWEKDAELAREWMRCWNSASIEIAPWGWDPFPTASRLINWCLALAVFPEPPIEVCYSVVQQTMHLLRNLEYDVRANHLLKNAQALVIVGSLLPFESSIGRKALSVGLPLLNRELREQFLDDGCHYELSLMYHCQVIEDCLITRAALRGESETLNRTIEAAARFLDAHVHPDGGIPMFGDAVLGQGLAPQTLVRLIRDSRGAAPEAQLAPVSARRLSGYHSMTTSDGQAQMIIKAGPPGPSYQLGHAHCDALSYELSVGERRVIVDSGTYEYEDTPMRAYCRSTRAHNTVSVAGREQLEFWSAFRVGNRYRPCVTQRQEQGETQQLLGRHDAFHPYQHGRVIRCHEARFWLIVDAVSGPGSFDAESFIHFHPDVVLHEEGGRWRAHVDEGDVTILQLHADTVTCLCGVEDPIQGWYCPEFGTRLPASVLVLQKACSGRAQFGYAIFPPGVEAPPESTLLEIWQKAASNAL